MNTHDVPSSLEPLVMETPPKYGYFILYFRLVGFRICCGALFLKNFTNLKVK